MESPSRSPHGGYRTPNAFLMHYVRSVEDDTDGKRRAEEWGFELAPYTLSLTKGGDWIANINGGWWTLRGGDPLEIDQKQGNGRGGPSSDEPPSVGRKGH